jgi:hypothetical protein
MLQTLFSKFVDSVFLNLEIFFIDIVPSDLYIVFLAGMRVLLVCVAFEIKSRKKVIFSDGVENLRGNIFHFLRLKNDYKKLLN